jgi:hypothetical protein
MTPEGLRSFRARRNGFGLWRIDHSHDDGRSNRCLGGPIFAQVAAHLIHPPSNEADGCVTTIPGRRCLRLARMGFLNEEIGERANNINEIRC